VLVHCNAGRGRSVVVTVAYLMTKHKTEGWDRYTALEAVQKLRPTAAMLACCGLRPQWRVLREFERRLVAAAVPPYHYFGPPVPYCQPLREVAALKSNRAPELFSDIRAPEAFSDLQDALPTSHLPPLGHPASADTGALPSGASERGDRAQDQGAAGRRDSGAGSMGAGNDCSTYTSPCRDPGCRAEAPAASAARTLDEDVAVLRPQLQQEEERLQKLMSGVEGAPSGGLRSHRSPAKRRRSISQLVSLPPVIELPSTLNQCQEGVSVRQSMRKQGAPSHYNAAAMHQTPPPRRSDSGPSFSCSAPAPRFPATPVLQEIVALPAVYDVETGEADATRASLSHVDIRASGGGIARAPPVDTIILPGTPLREGLFDTSDH